MYIRGEYSTTRWQVKKKDDRLFVKIMRLLENIAVSCKRLLGRTPTYFSHESMRTKGSHRVGEIYPVENFPYVCTLTSNIDRLFGPPAARPLVNNALHCGITVTSSIIPVKPCRAALPPAQI